MAGDLKRAREARGFSLAEVAERTRIPMKWLEALERGDTSAFPPGPFLAGYTKQYRSFLGLPPVGAAAAREEAPRLAPLRPPAPEPAPRPGVSSPAPEESERVDAVRRPHDEVTKTITLTSPRARVQRVGRMAIGGAALALLVVVGVAAFGRMGLNAGSEELGVAPDQELLVTSASGVVARVEGDGKELFRGALPSGRQVHFSAHDRLSIELEALEGVTLVYNGRTLKPLGAQSRPRRLVFIDDHGG